MKLTNILHISILQFLLLWLILMLTSWSLQAKQSSSLAKKNYTSFALGNAEAPVIDGMLNESIWHQGEWSSNFTQYQPNEGAKPSANTAFKVIYDSKFLYVGVQCFDDQPEKIESRMSRRDDDVGDWVAITLDSYHDLRSAFSFTVTAAGVKGDRMLSLNGTVEDPSWNPIWYAKSHINQDGWTAEMKIPLSQLRFGKLEHQVWGLQVVRRFFRNDEKSVWQRIPLDAPGWISEFGELHGLQAIKPQKQLEIQPFVVSSLHTFEKDASNPYRDHHLTKLTIGVDGKVGITNNFTLDFTINPDFGQVEADPAAIALDGFQLFFREQRPFFVENKNIFNYQFSNAITGGSFSNDNLFYSRRIGRSPQGSVQLGENEYVNAPERSTILGAIKLSGKNDKGLSVGIMESVTAAEYASTSSNGETQQTLIEPLTNYFVGRVQKDFNQNNTFLGAIITSTYRDLDANVNHLHQAALTAGIDFRHQWQDRKWYLESNLVTSHVKGSQEAMLNTQQAIVHLFQRVDATHVAIDSSKTSLTGTGGNIKFGKAGKGHLRFETGITWRSPELELNDIGFMRTADEIQHYLGITYSSLKPFGVFRSASFSYNHWSVWDFEGNHNYFDWDISAQGTFQNNWGAFFGIYSQPNIYDKSLLRGGPRIYLADQYGVWWSARTDLRKKLYINTNGWTKNGGAGSYQLFQSSIAFTYQPINQLSLSARPTFTTIKNRLQYNAQPMAADGLRFITSRLHQETWSLSLRLNYAINPNLSIQYYGQPFITVGKYSDFSYVAKPLATQQEEQLYFYGADQLFLDDDNNEYWVDEQANGTEDYRFQNPDFSFVQFRSNLVIRYEYKPGSELFLVWSQGITDTDSPRASLIDGIREQLFGQKAENTFLLKLTYRFVK